MSRDLSRRPSRLARVGQALLVALCALGAAAGGFLVLCLLGVLSPAALSQQLSGWIEEPAAAPAVAPAEDVTVPDAAPFRGVVLPLDRLDEAAALAGTANSLLLPMKQDDGALGYVSALPAAAEAKASAGDPRRNRDLLALNQTPGLYTVAQVSCLRDGALVRQDPSLALTRVSGSPWRDEDGQSWLDPADPKVQDYLAGICQELANLGFDEILLTHCAFPTQGQVDSLRPVPGKTQALEALCRRLQQALAGEDVTLSVQGLPDSSSHQPASGQTPAFLAAFGRVWAAPDDQQALAAFRPALLPEG